MLDVLVRWRVLCLSAFGPSFYLYRYLGLASPVGGSMPLWFQDAVAYPDQFVFQAVCIAPGVWWVSSGICVCCMLCAFVICSDVSDVLVFGGCSVLVGAVSSPV